MNTSKKKTVVKVELQDKESSSLIKSKGDFEYYQGNQSYRSETVEPEIPVKPGHLISRLDHNVIVSYNGEAVAVPPHGRVLIGNFDKLGALPKGIFLVPQSKRITN